MAPSFARSDGVSVPCCSWLSVCVFEETLHLLGQGRLISESATGGVLPYGDLLEQPPQIIVVWSFVELHPSAVGQVGGKLAWQSSAQDVYWCSHFLLADLFVFVLLRFGPHALPWECPLEQVDAHIADGLDVVTAGLHDAQVGVDRAIAGCARQILPFPVWDVLPSGTLTIALGQPEVDDGDVACPFPRAQKEIVGLDVSVDEAVRVDVLHRTDHLISSDEGGLE
mmetsp:Transcript_52134/g.130981  ORF Transcript_52134/g.130981 Transcript_52134/m.130981 type:complete len:225 (-) Transcript_52134:504-1178(-)